MKIRSFIVTASLVASGGLVAFAGSAQAALVTQCEGDGGAVTVNTDLVVPAGKSCTLSGTKVKGTVTVEDGADLVAAGVTFNGAVNVGKDAYLDLTDSTVKGALTAQDSFGAHLQDSSVKAVTAGKGFTYAVDSTLGGAVKTTNGELYVSGSAVNGGVSTDGNLYTDLYDSTVKGALTVSKNSAGAVLCESEILGNAAYANNADTLQLGGEGLLGSCAGATYVSGNLSVTDTNGTAVLDNTIVSGKLTATGNTPALQVGDTARVRGGITGETTEAAPASAARKAAPQDRGSALAAKAAERTADAKAAAHAAGDSGL